VVAVVLWHTGVSWARGGFLGLELFFTLSGFLITTLLIREWLASGTVGLASFWAQRARRVLPALLVLVLVVGIYSSIRGRYAGSSGLLGNGFSTLLGYANWHLIAAGSHSLGQVMAPPFQPTWSLSVGAQFSVVWPLLVFGLAGLASWRWRRRAGAPASGPPSEAAGARLLSALLVLALVMIAASAVDAALLFHGGTGLDRVGYGTDTRASGLLAGAALAILVTRLGLTARKAGTPQTGPKIKRSAQPGAGFTALISLGSAVVLAATLALTARVHPGQDNWLYPWGLLLVDAAAVSLIAVVLMSPRATASRVLALAPLRWIGTISYGLYLWQAPLFLWIAPTGSLHGAGLLIVRCAVTVAVAVLSYVLVEAPVRQRRWPVWTVWGLAPISAGAGLACLALAASAGAIPRPPARVPPPVQPSLAGDQGPCRIRLANTTDSGQVAPPQLQEESFQTRALGHGTVIWPHVSTSKRFTTCPPKRALLIGDSIAFTIGVPYLYDEQRYGMAISNAAVLGCAFGVRGELDVNGTWKAPPRGCPSELARWETLANRFGAQEIIFELGYRDEFNWKWHGKIVHLGQTAYDTYVESRIRRFITVLGEHGRRKLLFLSIPQVQPLPQPDGRPAPQGTSLRHTEINHLIRQAARSDGVNASVLDIDTWLSPAGRYTTDLNGRLCRFDGIHVTVYCSKVLEPHVLGAARGLLDPAAGTTGGASTTGGAGTTSGAGTTTLGASTG
jgi:peptidoglycan/LPS O-acetylase OafA/YrhL